MGLLIFVYFTVFAFLGGEMFDMPKYFYWMFLCFLMLAANLVLVQYKFGRFLSFWITTGFVSIIFCLGMYFATKKQLIVCFLPLLVEGALIASAVALVYFRAPERWCQDTRFVQLYLNSYVLYSLLFVNFVFEVSNILFLTLKLNDGKLDDDLTWWEVGNIYND